MKIQTYYTINLVKQKIEYLGDDKKKAFKKADNIEKNGEEILLGIIPFEKEVAKTIITDRLKNGYYKEK